jgi:hypothetical protein
VEQDAEDRTEDRHAEVEAAVAGAGDVVVQRPRGAEGGVHLECLGKEEVGQGEGEVVADWTVQRREESGEAYGRMAEAEDSGVHEGSLTGGQFIRPIAGGRKCRLTYHRRGYIAPHIGRDISIIAPKDTCAPSVPVPPLTQSQSQSQAVWRAPTPRHSQLTKCTMFSAVIQKIMLSVARLRVRMCHGAGYSTASREMTVGTR